MRYIFLFIFLLININLFAQTITVIDKSTLEPVKGVVITAGENQVITNEKGQTDISVLDTSITWITNHIAYLSEKITYNELLQLKLKLRLTSRIFPLNEIVISGNKFSERKSTVAHETLVLREQEIHRLTPATPADLLEKSGQVFVQRSQYGGGSPILRGFEANKVLLVLDGVRLNNAIFRGGHLHNIANQDEQTLNRAEIIYGSGPVVYGSDALGGVISLFTEDPKLTDSLSFKINYKAAGKYISISEGQNYHLGFNIAGKKFASLTTASISDYGNLKQGRQRNSDFPDFGKRFWYVERIETNDTIADIIVTNEDPDIQIPSGFTQNNFLQKFLFKQSPLVYHLLNIQVNETSPQSFYARLTLTDENDLPVWAEWNYGRQNHFLLSYKTEWIASNKIFDETKLIAAYQRYKESRETRRFNSEWRNYRTEEVLMYSVNNDYLKRINSRHEIVYGIEYWYNDVQSNANQLNIINDSTADLDTRYPDGGSIMWAGAGYLSHTWNYKPDLIIHSGIRATTTSLHSKFQHKSFFDFPYNEISQQNTSLTGSIGTVVNPKRNLKITAAVSTAFRTPNVDDIAKVFDTSPGLIVIPNPDLAPERTYTFEAGFSHTHKSALRTSVTGWYTFYNNIISLQPSQFSGEDSILFNGILSGIVQQKNNEEAFLYGVSGSLEADVTHSFSVYSFLTFTYGRIITGFENYPLDHIPPLYGKTGIAWKGNKLRIDAYSLYNAEKKLKDYNLFGEDNFIYATPEGVPAWYTVNLSIYYQPLKQINLTVAAENLLDKNYRTFASGISAPGRNFIFIMKFYF